MSHLHFDHAGGLLLADGSRAFPRARIVAQRAEWEFALGDNSRLVASYDQPELRLVADWGAEGWAEGDRELLPGVSVVRTGGPLGRPPGDRRPRHRPGRAVAGLLRRPVHAAVGREPALGDRVRRLPAGQRRGQGRAVPAGGRRGLARRAVARASRRRSGGSCPTATGSSSRRSDDVRPHAPTRSSARSGASARCASSPPSRRRTRPRRDRRRRPLDGERRQHAAVAVHRDPRPGRAAPTVRGRPAPDARAADRDGGDRHRAAGPGRPRDRGRVRRRPRRRAPADRGLDARASAPGSSGSATTCARRCSELLGLPPDRLVRTIIALGYPTEAARQPKAAPGEARLPRDEAIFRERWPG